MSGYRGIRRCKDVNGHKIAHVCRWLQKYEQVKIGTQIEVGIRMQADATAQADIRAGMGMRMQGYSSKTSEHKVQVGMREMF